MASRPHDDPQQPLPVANYTTAREKAVQWLGDRYLLAKPINPAVTRAASTVVHTSPQLWQSKTPGPERYRSWLQRFSSS